MKTLPPSLALCEEFTSQCCGVFLFSSLLSWTTFLPKVKLPVTWYAGAPMCRHCNAYWCWCEWLEVNLWSISAKTWRNNAPLLRPSIGFDVIKTCLLRLPRSRLWVSGGGYQSLDSSSIGIFLCLQMHLLDSLYQIHIRHEPLVVPVKRELDIYLINSASIILIKRKKWTGRGCCFNNPDSTYNMLA